MEVFVSPLRGIQFDTVKRLRTEHPHWGSVFAAKRPADGAERLRRISGKSLEQTGIGDHQTIVVNLDLAYEIAVERLVSIATEGLKARISLRIRNDIQIGNVYVGCADLG